MKRIIIELPIEEWDTPRLLRDKTLVEWNPEEISEYVKRGVKEILTGECSRYNFVAGSFYDPSDNLVLFVRGCVKIE